MNDSLILVGAGGHANSCIDVIQLENKYKIQGIVGQNSELGKTILGYPVIGTDEDLEDLFSKYKNAIICVGQIKNFDIRINLFTRIKKIGYNLPTIISPRAYISKTATVGEGSIIMHNVLINQNCTVGKNCIINTGSILEHDVKIGDQTHISTSCVLNGGVQVGELSFVGSGTVVKEMVTIGSKVIIGMQSKILKNVENGSFYK